MKEPSHRESCERKPIHLVRVNTGKQMRKTNERVRGCSCRDRVFSPWLKFLPRVISARGCKPDTHRVVSPWP